jgi:Zn-dependent protease/predicted transcriptional regulator
MGKGLQLMRLGGIKIEIDFSWIFIAALVVFSLGSGYFPANYPLWGEGQIWIAAIITAILFFVSVLLHELSHSFVAKSRGIEVDSIRLFIFGGVSNIKREAKTPFEEFIIAVVGPLCSIVLAGIAYLIASVATPGSSVQAVASYLAIINLSLGIFNLIPGFPLDGGRVFRSILWGTIKDYTKATRIAAGVGRIIGYLFIAAGIWLALAGGLIDGLWIGLIGWFIISAASQSYQQVVVSNLLRGVSVGQVMSRPNQVAFPNMTLNQLVHQHFIYQGERVVPVVENGYLAGLVTPENVRNIPPEQWNNMTVAQIMTRRQNLQVARPNDDLQTTLETLGQQERAQYMLPVINQEGYFVGILTPLEVMRFMQLRQQLGAVPQQNNGYYPPAANVPYNQPGQPYNQNQPQDYNQPGYDNDRNRDIPGGGALPQ